MCITKPAGDDIAALMHDYTVLRAFVEHVCTDATPLRPERTLQVGDIKAQRDRWRRLAQEVREKLEYIPHGPNTLSR